MKLIRRLRRKAKPAGLSPGTLIHPGQSRLDEARITVFGYDEDHLQEEVIPAVEAYRPDRDSQRVTWINCDGLPQVETLQRLGQLFALHPLVLEDILDVDQRPKLDDQGDYLYIVLKMLAYDEQNKHILAEQINLILGSNTLLSLQEGIKGDVSDPVKERLRRGRGRIRGSGADYLAYALLDAIVDHYFIILEKVVEEIERLEEDLVDNPSSETLAAIYTVKRELIFLHKSIWPLREVIRALIRGESSLFKETTIVFLRDVYDHTVQVIDLVETYRDLTAGMLDIYLSSTSNHTNAVMKVLTVIATLFMPITFITSLYGMNFQYMPELAWRWGYPAVWLVVIMISLAMVIYFRQKQWL